MDTQCGTCGNGHIDRPLLCKHLEAGCRPVNYRPTTRAQYLPSRVAMLPRADSYGRLGTCACLATLFDRFRNHCRYVRTFRFPQASTTSPTRTIVVIVRFLSGTRLHRWRLAALNVRPMSECAASFASERW